VSAQKNNSSLDSLPANTFTQSQNSAFFFFIFLRYNINMPRTIFLVKLSFEQPFQRCLSSLPSLYFQDVTHNIKFVRFPQKPGNFLHLPRTITTISNFLIGVHQHASWCDFSHQTLNFPIETSTRQGGVPEVKACLVRLSSSNSLCVCGVYRPPDRLCIEELLGMERFNGRTFGLGDGTVAVFNFAAWLLSSIFWRIGASLGVVRTETYALNLLIWKMKIEWN